MSIFSEGRCDQSDGSCKSECPCSRFHRCSRGRCEPGCDRDSDCRDRRTGAGMGDGRGRCHGRDCVEYLQDDDCVKAGDVCDMETYKCVEGGPECTKADDCQGISKVTVAFRCLAQVFLLESHSCFKGSCDPTLKCEMSDNCPRNIGVCSEDNSTTSMRCVECERNYDCLHRQGPRLLPVCFRQR